MYMLLKEFYLRGHCASSATFRLPVPFTAACVNAGDVIFAVDESGSIGRSNFNRVLNFVSGVIDQFDVDAGRHGNGGMRVGLVTFGDDVKRQFDLNQYLGKVALLNALKVTYSGGTTNTSAALK